MYYETICLALNIIDKHNNIKTIVFFRTSVCYHLLC